MKLFGAGGFIGTVIALAAVGVSFVELELEEERARTAIMAGLLRDEPAETANLILQAGEMGVVVLSEDDTARLIGLVDRDLRVAVVGSDADFAESDTSDPEVLALELDSPDAGIRVRAAREITRRGRASARFTEAMIATLEERARDALSSTGLHSLVFLLDRQEPGSWNDELRLRCVEVLEETDAARVVPPPTKRVADALVARLSRALEGA